MLFPKISFAFDYEIKCNTKTCSDFPSSSFFSSSTNWTPGMWERKIVRVTNSNAKDAILVRSNLLDYVPDKSSRKLEDHFMLSTSIPSISSTQKDVTWAGSLKNLHDTSSSPPFIAYVKPKSSLDITYIVALNSLAGDECQGASVEFNLNFIFTSEEYVPPKNTSTPTKGPDAISKCSDSVPKFSPGVSFVSKNSDSVTLELSYPSDDFTSYILYYGTGSGSYSTVNPSIGGPGIKEYQVSGLNNQDNYYFASKVINGCSIGSISSELVVQMITSTSPKDNRPATPTTGSVLGTTIRPTPTLSESPSISQSTTLQAIAPDYKRWYMWIILMVIIAMLIVKISI